MGCDPEAHIMYGYYLGSEEEWKIQGLGEYGSLITPWYNQDDEEADFLEAIEAELLKMVGFTETRETRPDAYYPNKTAAEKLLKVKVRFTGYDGSLDYTLYVEGSHHSEEWGASPIGELTIPDGADQALEEAIKYLGITPTQERPGWVLGALYF